VVVSHRNPGGDHETILTMYRYPDNMTDYAESVCGDSVTDKVANEMRWLSLDTLRDNYDSSPNLVDPPEEDTRSC
jgi:hypothetical protein